MYYFRITIQRSMYISNEHPCLYLKLILRKPTITQPRGLNHTLLFFNCSSAFFVWLFFYFFTSYFSLLFTSASLHFLSCRPNSYIMKPANTFFFSRTWFTMFNMKIFEKFKTKTKQGNIRKSNVHCLTSSHVRALSHVSTLYSGFVLTAFFYYRLRYRLDGNLATLLCFMQFYD